ncbi:MAG: hypothetical protein LUQ37_07775, partial [Methanoregulaceae archaeon]|nr:hypothetical protein [Methanoregulaceae archaeon]
MNRAAPVQELLFMISLGPGWERFFLKKPIDPGVFSHSGGDIIVALENVYEPRTQYLLTMKPWKRDWG